MRQSYEVATQTPTIDDSSLEEARELIGVLLRRGDQQWNRYVTPDATKHFSWGIGDENPLYTTEDYGRTTRWGTGLGTGCFLYTIDTTIVAPKLRGVQWIYTGTDFEWYQPLRHGDALRTEVRLIDAKRLSGGKASKFIIQSGEVLYFSEETGDLVAKAVGHTGRIPRAKAEGGMSYEPRETHRYTEAELAEIEDAIAAEVVRGAEPRFWDDVSVDDELQPVVKGPLNITDMICWYSTHHIYRAHERATRYRWRHPADAYKDPDTGAQDHPARGHTQAFMAYEVGMPGIYDIGPQRISWCSQVVTNWMGDDGFMRALSIQVRRPNVLGDTTWVKARVVGKSDEDQPVLAGEGTYRDVHLEVWCENQLGETTAKGTATVALLKR